MTSLSARTGWGPRRADRPGQASPSHSQPARLLFQTQEAGPRPPKHTHTHLHKHTPQMTPQTHPHIYVISCLPPRSPFCNTTPFSFSTQPTFCPRSTASQMVYRRIYLMQTACGSSSFSMTFCSLTKLNVKPLNLIILDGFKFSLNVWR